MDYVCKLNKSLYGLCQILDELTTKLLIGFFVI